jgi:hypothetical protein
MHVFFSLFFFIIIIPARIYCRIAIHSAYPDQFLVDLSRPDAKPLKRSKEMVSIIAEILVQEGHVLGHILVIPPLRMGLKRRYKQASGHLAVIVWADKIQVFLPDQSYQFLPKPIHTWCRSPEFPFDDFVIIAPFG